jgi:hypothetical protein
MPNPTIAAGTVIAVHEERRRKSSSFFVIGIDLTGRLQLPDFEELFPATLTDRFVGAFVVVPASRFRWIVSAAEGTF